MTTKQYLRSLRWFSILSSFVLVLAFLTQTVFADEETQDKSEEFTNGIGMTFKLIPAGEFRMGSSSYRDETPILWDDLWDDIPQHRVRISRSFYIGKTEVTQEQWMSVMDTKPWEDRKGVKEGPDHAANCMSWMDARDFVKKLSMKEGRTYRLPTEAEWEYCCRAGKTTTYHFSDSSDDLSAYAWWGGGVSGDGNCRNENYPHAVMKKKPNSWGLYDMHGNVSEWCQDWYDPYYYRSYAPRSDPKGPAASSKNRVLRGGSWAGCALGCAARLYDVPVRRESSYGFRVVLEVSTDTMKK